MVYFFLNLRNTSNAANPRKDRNTNAVIPVSDGKLVTNTVYPTSSP